MKSFALAAPLLALLSTVNAATVTLTETPCIQNNTKLETFTIDIGPVVAHPLASVCGLKLVSADGADVTQIQCHGFKDAAGKESGSRTFDISTPALISTNPVQLGSLQCILKRSASGSASSASTSGAPTSGASTSTTSTVVVTSTAAASTVLQTTTITSAPASSAPAGNTTVSTGSPPQPITLTSTVLATANHSSTHAPSGSGTTTGAPIQVTGAAAHGQAGFNVVAVGAVLAAVLF